MQKILETLKSPSFRRWALAVGAAVVLVFGAKIGVELNETQRQELIALVLGVLGFSNLNDMVTKRAAQAGADAVKAPPSGLTK